MTIIIQLTAGMIGSVGFALIFHVRKRYMPFVLAGSFLCWGIYLLALSRMPEADVFLPTLLSGFITALYAEIMARLCKCPSTIFFLTSVIPLIPGRSLYYCFQSIVENRHCQALSYGTAAFLTALGIALGMAAAWTICFFARKISHKR